MTKLDTMQSGDSSLVYSSYLGGNNNDDGFGIAVDGSGNAYVTGYTKSTNFPTLNGYPTGWTDWKVFVTKIDTTKSGSACLRYSTYWGGTGSDIGCSIAADGSGNAYVTGYTTSTDLPTLNQYQTDQAGMDLFVTKFDTTQSGIASLAYSTYLGGNGDGEMGRGIAVDGSGNAYVTGCTDSTDFPTLNQYQTDQPGMDVFVTKIDTTKSGNASLVYSTYLGGSGDDGYFNAYAGIAVDGSGNAYVTGRTAGTDFPTLNQFQTDQAGDDAFITKISTQAFAVTAPNGGETWVSGSTHNITWTSMGAIANVMIEYSADNGANWTTVIASTLNTGSYSWTVPYAASTQCLVRVSDASNAEIYDASDSVFNIFSDITEPNNDSATAADLTMGITENLIYDGGAQQDIDWYRFFVPVEAEGQDLKVNVRVTSPYPDPIPYPGWASDLDFDLLDDSLRVLGSTVSRSDNETLYLHDVASGWYYIFVGFSTTEYADSSTYARYSITLEAGTEFGLGYITGRVVDGSAQGVQDVFLLLASTSRRLEHLPALHDDRGRRELRYRVPAGDLYARVHQCGDKPSPPIRP